MSKKNNSTGIDGFLSSIFNSMNEEEGYQPSESFGNLPEGWISIDEHLPIILADDMFNGGTTYKVKNEAGEIWESKVSDHDLWKFLAKEAGITHWLNEKK